MLEWFCILAVMIVRNYVCVLTHKTVHPPKVNFTVHEIIKGTEEVEQVSCTFCKVKCMQGT